MKVRAFDDLDLPSASIRDDASHFRPLISGVGEDAFDKREAASRGPQQFAGSVSILDVGRQNTYAEQEAQRIDDDVALAAGDLLARVVPLRVERRAPF